MLVITKCRGWYYTIFDLLLVPPYGETNGVNFGESPMCRTAPIVSLFAHVAYAAHVACVENGRWNVIRVQRECRSDKKCQIWHGESHGAAETASEMLVWEGLKEFILTIQSYFGYVPDRRLQYFAVTIVKYLMEIYRDKQRLGANYL